MAAATLTAKAVMDASGFLSPTQQMTRALRGLQQWTGLAGISTSGLSSAFAVGGAAGVGFAGAMSVVKAGLAGVQVAAGLLRDELKHGFGLAMAAQSAETQFRVLTKSAEQAKSIMEDVNNFTLQTPFSTEGSLGAVKSLMGAGVATDKLMSRMRMLGEISGGNTEVFSGLATVYGQVMAKGKLLSQDFNQIAERGINLRQVLADELRIGVDEVAKAMADGKITATHFHNALHNLATGKFGGSLQEANKDLAGVFARLNEIRDSFSRDVALGLMDKWNITETTSDLADFAEGLKTKVVPDVVSAFDDMSGALFDFTDNVRALAMFAPESLNPLDWMVKVAAMDFKAGPGMFGGIGEINTRRDLKDYFRSIRESGAAANANKPELAKSERIEGTAGLPAHQTAAREFLHGVFSGGKGFKPLAGGSFDHFLGAIGRQGEHPGMVNRHDPLGQLMAFMEFEKNGGLSTDRTLGLRQFGSGLLRGFGNVGSDVGFAGGRVASRFRIRGEEQPEQNPTGALVAGSREAFSAIIAAMTGRDRNKPELAELKAIGKGLDEAKNAIVKAIQGQISGVVNAFSG